MKKNALALLALLLVSALLLSIAGCAPAATTGSTPSTNAPTTSSTGQSSTSPSDGPVTISFWHQQSAIAEYYEGIVARYEASSGNTVELTVYENDAYKDKLKVAMGADSLPDVLTHWAGGPMNTYIEAGKLLDLTDYMNADNYKDRWMDAAIELGSYNGRIYALGAGDLMSFPIFYNTELFTQYGFEVPETLGALEEICDAFVADGIIPFALANLNKWTGSVYYMYLVDRIGSTQAFYNAANRIDGGSFEDEAFTLAGEKLQEWVRKGYFPEGVNGLSNATGQDRQLLYSGQAAMWSYPSTGLSTVLKESPEFYEKLGVMNFPAYTGGTGDTTAVVGSAGQNFFSIASSCVHPDAAWGLLVEMGSEETVAAGLEIGRIVPVEGILGRVEEPLRAETLNLLISASSVQLAYDQYLTPTLGELHKSTCQELFGLTMTPAQVNKAMEEAAVSEYGK